MDAVGGRNQVLVALADGSVWSLKPDNINDPLNGSYTPTQILGLKDITKVAAAFGRTFFALTKFGKVYSWGENMGGMLGDQPQRELNLTSSRDTPKMLNIPDNVTDIKVGGTFVLALTDRGTVYSWGNNQAGQTGTGKSKICYGTGYGKTCTTEPAPRQIDAMGIVAIAAGNDHSLALTTDCKVLAWGNNYGNSNSTDLGGHGSYRTGPDPIYVPVYINELDGIKEIAAGLWVSYVRKTDGSVWSFGSYGFLGRSRFCDGKWICQISSIYSPVKKMAAGPDSQISAVMTTDNSVLGWGQTDYPVFYSTAY